MADTGGPLRTQDVRGVRAGAARRLHDPHPHPERAGDAVAGARRRRLADLHGRSWIHVTTPQNLELHHVAARSVPSVLAAVEALGLTNRSACGHTHRNVMACPDAGVGLDEPFDCGPDARAVAAAIVARAAEINVVMPSRINLAFGGCPACADHARLNDGGFQSMVVNGESGYRLWAGGSLGTMPFVAAPLAEFIPRRHTLASALALTETLIDLGDLDRDDVCTGITESVDRPRHVLAIELERDPLVLDFRRHQPVDKAVETLARLVDVAGKTDGGESSVRFRPAGDALRRLEGRGQRTVEAPALGRSEPAADPVVTTTTWGGRSSRASVAYLSGRSSPKGRVRTTGPKATLAPRRRSNSACSSARRWAVRPTLQPASGGMLSHGGARPMGPTFATGRFVTVPSILRACYAR
jgi:hypothetical protein